MGTDYKDHFRFSLIALLTAGAVLLLAAGCDESTAAAAATKGEVVAATNETSAPARAEPVPAPAVPESEPEAAEESFVREQPVAAVPARVDPFTGTFVGTFRGETGTMTLSRDGRRVSGRVDDFAISGTASGDTVSGPLIDPASGVRAGSFELIPKQGGLEMRLTLRDPRTGDTVILPIHFARKTEQQPAASRAAEKTRDARLVGHWRYTWAKGEGGFSMAVDHHLVLRPDGTCSRGRGAVAGGSADVGFSSEGDGDTAASTGRWRTENRVLYVSDTPDGPMRALARYAVSDDNMMLTYGSGSKEVWERQ